MEIPSSEIFSLAGLRRSLNRFDTRINRQTNQIYEALPEVTGMHFTQADHVSSIQEKGFIGTSEDANYVYSFDKKDTNEHYGDRLEEADAIGLPHFDVRHTIKRFHAAFIEGFSRYGLEGLRYVDKSTSESVRDFLIKHKDILPAVVFADISKVNAIPKHKSNTKLSQAYFNNLEAEHILNTITLEDEDIHEVARIVERGVSLEDSLKKVFVNKTVEWLLLRVEELRIEKFKKMDEEYETETKENPLHEWRKLLDEELGSEAVDSIIKNLRERTDMRSQKSCIQILGGVEYISPSGLTIAEIFLDQIRSKKELAVTLEAYGEEDRKIAEHLPVHSFGGDELIKLGKCKMAEQVKVEATINFARPPESIIYFGSLDDVELTLLTGAKEIYMVDPGLDEEFIQEMIERVRQYGKNISYNDAEKILTFDLESRNVIVRIFQETMQEFNEKKGIKAEVVIMYNKAPGMKTLEAKEALVPNGVCIDNREDGAYSKLDEE